MGMSRIRLFAAPSIGGCAVGVGTWRAWLTLRALPLCSVSHSVFGGICGFLFQCAHTTDRGRDVPGIVGGWARVRHVAAGGESAREPEERVVKGVWLSLNR